MVDYEFTFSYRNTLSNSTVAIHLGRERLLRNIYLTSWTSVESCLLKTTGIIFNLGMIIFMNLPKRFFVKLGVTCHLTIFGR